MKYILAIFLLMMLAPAVVEFKHKHDRETKVRSAVETLRGIYVLTSNQEFRIVYANVWAGNACFEYLADDARQQPTLRYALAEKDSKFILYDLDQEDLEGRCNAAGVNETDLAEEASR